MRPPAPHPHIATILDRLCWATRHFGACALLNGRWYLFDDGQERVLTVTYPFKWTARLWSWAEFPQ